MHSKDLTLSYIDFLTNLEDTYPNLSMGSQLSDLQQEREMKLKEFFERCIDTYGEVRTDCVDLWIKYIDYETMRNNLCLANALCF